MIIKHMTFIIAPEGLSHVVTTLVTRPAVAKARLCRITLAKHDTDFIFERYDET